MNTERITLNESRAELGAAAIRAACGTNAHHDDEEHASDTIADILHAVYGPHGHKRNSVWGQDLLDRAFRSWQGDDEDEGLEA